MDHYTAHEAALKVGISYSNFMARTRKPKDNKLRIEVVKVGHAVFCHKDEVARARKVEKNRRKSTPSS